MSEFARQLTTHFLSRDRLPQLVVALGITELFYKLHSFIVEFAAFLLTWLLLDAAATALKSVLTRRGENRS